MDFKLNGCNSDSWTCYFGNKVNEQQNNSAFNGDS